MALDGSHIVCPKVNLADIFFVARPNENQSYRNKIDRKHVDFLLLDPTTMKPVMGVELDDVARSFTVGVDSTSKDSTRIRSGSVTTKPM